MAPLWNILGAIFHFYASLVRFSANGQADTAAWIWRRRLAILLTGLFTLIAVAALDIVGCIGGLPGKAPLGYAAATIVAALVLMRAAAIQRRLVGLALGLLTLAGLWFLWTNGHLQFWEVDLTHASRILIAVATVLLVGVLWAAWLVLVGLAKWLELNVELIQKPAVEWAATGLRDGVVALLKEFGLAIEAKPGELKILDAAALSRKVASTELILIAVGVVQAVLFAIPDDRTLGFAFFVPFLIFLAARVVRRLGWDPTVGQLIAFRFIIAFGTAAILIALVREIHPAIAGKIAAAAGLFLVALTQSFREILAPHWSDPASRVLDILTIIGVVTGLAFVLRTVVRLVKGILLADPRPIAEKIREAMGQRELAAVRREYWGPRVSWVTVLFVLLLFGGVFVSVYHLGWDEPEPRAERRTQNATQSAPTPAPAPARVEPSRTGQRLGHRDEQGLRELEELERRDQERLRRYSWLSDSDS